MQLKLQVDGWVKVILDALYDGVLIADSNGVVRYINPAYTRITSVEENKILGENLVNIRPGAKLPDVILSGKQQLGVIRKEGPIEYIVNMVPIKEHNQIVGGISILNEINDIYKLTEQLKTSHQTIKRLESHVKSHAKARYNFDSIIAEDVLSLELKAFAKRIAPKDSNILISGESGTGKELYAQAIHNTSLRNEEPFVPINCASFDSHLIESELFGYEDGAFTGAKKGGKIGLFEIANNGTLFLDEIGEMDFNLQAKLLRVLQEQSIRRIGGSSEIPINVRIIAATNRDLVKMINTEKFRMDLFYRISVMPLHVLPLRERKADIVPLSEYFLSIKQEVKYELDDEVRMAMITYEWPGNIRELRNALEFAKNISEDHVIRLEHLPKAIQNRCQSIKSPSIKALSDATKDFEKLEIMNALRVFGNHIEGKKKAAQVLGISLATLYNKIKE